MVKVPRIRDQQRERLQASVKEICVEYVGEGAVEEGEARDFGPGQRKKNSGKI